MEGKILNAKISSNDGVTLYLNFDIGEDFDYLEVAIQSINKLNEVLDAYSKKDLKKICEFSKDDIDFTDIDDIELINICTQYKDDQGNLISTWIFKDQKGIDVKFNTHLAFRSNN
jgi:hypothetical protein